MKKRVFWVCLLLVFQLAVFCWRPGAAQALTEEQKIFNEAWRIVSQAYVDDTFNGQNWWRVRQNALRHPLADREGTYTAIQQMLASLGDPFTRLMRPSQYRSLQTTTAGELIGVGLQIALHPETGNLEVIAPIAGSPADRAGIQPRDRILKIDGISTTELSLDEAAERMRGRMGTSITLMVGRTADAGQPFEVQLTRDRIALNPVHAEFHAETKGPSIGYIRLNQFNANAVSQMAQAINHLEAEGANGYILDLRNNPGGLLQAGIEIARLWLGQGTVVYTVNREGLMGTFTAEGEEALTQDPLVVLVNQGSASASEILAGALQDNHRAQILGERTFGKGSIQSLFNLSDGSGLAVTIAKYETPSHRDINKSGILPDRVIPLDILTREQVATEADQQYQAAVQLLAADPVVAGAS